MQAHSFSVHGEEPHIEILPCRCASCHFDLYRGNGYACDSGIELFGQIKTGGTESTTDIENVRAGLYVCELSETLNELKLRLFFRFIATNPISVMKMLAPEGPIERADEVVMLDDSLLVV